MVSLYYVLKHTKYNLTFLNTSIYRHREAKMNIYCRTTAALKKNKQDTLTTVLVLTTADSTIITGLITAEKLSLLLAI